MPGFVNSECALGRANYVDAYRTHGGRHQLHRPALACAFDTVSSWCDRSRMLTGHLSLADWEVVSKPCIVANPDRTAVFGDPPGTRLTKRKHPIVQFGVGFSPCSIANCHQCQAR